MERVPNKKPNEIIAFITTNSNVDNATAWRDTKIIQELLGKINNPSKDWHRYKFNLMVTKAYDIAEIKQDPDAMQKAANIYAKAYPIFVQHHFILAKLLLPMALSML